MTDVRALPRPRFTRLSSHASRAPLAALATLTAALAGGCDADDSTLDYDAVAHVDLRAMKTSPWMIAAMGKGPVGPKIQIDGDLDPACVEVLAQAEAMTVGTGGKKLELYVEGPRDSSVAQACIRSLKDLAKDEAVTLKAQWLDDDLLAIAAGESPLPTPSRARLESLRAADPSATGGKTAWWTAKNAAGKPGVEYVESWADVGKGLDAHVSVQFDSEAAAAKTHAEVSLGLTALRLSGEMSDLVSAIAVEAGGDTVTADVHASESQMKKLVASSKAKAEAKSSSGAGAEPGTRGRLEIEIGGK